MGIKTEDMVKGLPGKEITAGVDWLGILDSFDPTQLEEKYINECARRNSYDTCYRWDTPPRPIEERIRHSEWAVKSSRKDLENCVARIESEGLSHLNYKLARAALIKAIGDKGAAEYNRREYEKLGEEGRRRQAEEYRQWEADWDAAREHEKMEYERLLESDAYFYDEPASVHEKVIRIRKGVKASNGKPLTQRDFAKLLSYPINKYTEAEKIDRYGRSREPESEVEYELLEKLVMICHANPYWLFDPDCEAYYAVEDLHADALQMKDEPCVYATVDVILRWIKEGKPRITSWIDAYL